MTEYISDDSDSDTRRDHYLNQQKYHQQGKYKYHLPTFLPRVWRHQFGYGTRRKAARGCRLHSLHPVRGGECGERQRRSIARTSRDAWRTPCRTPRNVRSCAVLRFDGRSYTPCVSTRSATGLSAYGLSLGFGSASSASEMNERHVCSAGRTRPSRACRIWGTSS